MIDIHNHLLFGIDDGSESLEDSINALRIMGSLGYTDIILTPHYIKDSSYSSSASENFKILKKLKKAVKENNIDINLYLGNEIFMDDDIYDLLKKEEIYSLNGSAYLLIELPMNGEYPNYIDIFEYLMDKGCHVILAHPERYFAFQEDFDKIKELHDIGVLFQCNISSLNGKYGRSPEKLIKKLLKSKMVSFLGTDTHHTILTMKDFNKAKKTALKYISNSEFENLVINNPSEIIH